MRDKALMGKAPLAGQVKTRSVPPLRHEQAADLYDAYCATYVLLRFSSDIDVPADLCYLTDRPLLFVVMNYCRAHCIGCSGNGGNG